MEDAHPAGLSDAYAQAWDDWHASGEADLWDATIADGLDTPVRWISSRT
jgi:hypothetical protein